jgi:urocanate hydratase
VAESRVQAANPYKPVRAPRGPQLSCKGWQQEAALRLLMNSVDPAVAEHPEELIVSSGIGKLACDWEAFHAIAKSLQTIEDDETLVIHDGESGPILKTNLDVPRVLVVNSAFPPPARNERSPASERAAPKQAARMAARIAADWMFTGPASELPDAYEILRAAAHKHFGGSLRGRLVVAAGMGGMGGALALAATLNSGAFLGIDADAARIKRYVKTGYCEVMVNNLDEALRILKNAVRKRAPASVGLISNPAELIPALARRGVLPDLLTDLTSADETYLPPSLTVAQALEWSDKDPRAYVKACLDSIAANAGAMVELKKAGAVILFELGNETRARAFARGVADAYDILIFGSEDRTPDLAPSRDLLTIVALSGDTSDIARIDDLFPSLFPDSELERWVAIARRHPSPGLPARSCWMSADDASKLGVAINDLVAAGAIKAPVVMGRSIRQSRSRNLLGIYHPLGQAANSGTAGEALADSPELRALLNGGRGASWLSVHASRGADEGGERSTAFVVVDGSPKTSERIERLFAKDFAS